MVDMKRAALNAYWRTQTDHVTSLSNRKKRIDDVIFFFQRLIEEDMANTKFTNCPFYFTSLYPLLSFTVTYKQIYFFYFYFLYTG